MEVNSARQHGLPLGLISASVGRRVVLLAGAFLLLFTGASLPVEAQSPEYQPIGVRWGSVLVFPVVKVREAYNDNIFQIRLSHFVEQAVPSLETLAHSIEHLQ